MLGIFLFLMTSFPDVVNGASCQDVDHTACTNMAQQNPNMCSDATLSMQVCPQYCGNCPLVCYSCQSSSDNISSCNSISCASGEQCMIQRKTLSNGGNMYNMLCGPKMVCGFFGKRSVDENSSKSERSLTLTACCDTDFCNIPSVFGITSTTISSTPSTPPTTPSTLPTTPSKPPTTPSTLPSTLPTTPSPQNNCVKDVVIMIEDTHQISNYFDVIQDNLKRLISHLDIGKDKTRLSVSLFHDNKVTQQWQLNRFYDKTSLMNAVDRLKPVQYGFSLFGYNKIAVYHAVTDTNHGDRVTVPNVLVIVSQALLPCHDFHTMTQASYSETEQKLRQQYPEVITIGLVHANKREMRGIASNPHYFFYVPEPESGTFASQLSETVTKVANIICP